MHFKRNKAEKVKSNLFKLLLVRTPSQQLICIFNIVLLTKRINNVHSSFKLRYINYTKLLLCKNLTYNIYCHKF